MTEALTRPALAAAAVLLLGGLVSCSWMGKSKAGRVGGVLAPCPGSPNCVCSETQGESWSVAPLAVSGDHEACWEDAVSAVRELGGRVRTNENGYLWATFQTKVLRFVDDLELRMDETSNVIHVRSASRVGYSDLGLNGRRVEQLRETYENLQEADQ